MTTARVFLAQLTGIQANGASGGPSETALATNLPIGQIAASAALTTGSTSVPLTIPVPPWVVAGMNVFDVTTGLNVGTVASVSGSTVTLAADAAHASQGAADVLQFGFTPSDLAAGFAAGQDVAGNVAVAYLKAAELAKLISDIEKVITSSQDSAANTILADVAALL
jgi:hypothetical protein